MFKNNLRLYICRCTYVYRKQDSLQQLYPPLMFFSILFYFLHKTDLLKFSCSLKKRQFGTYNNLRVWYRCITLTFKVLLRNHPVLVSNPYPLFLHPWLHRFDSRQIRGKPTQRPFSLALCPRPTLPSDPWTQDPLPWPPFAPMDPSPPDPLSHAPFGFFTHHISLLSQLLQLTESS